MGAPEDAETRAAIMVGQPERSQAEALCGAVSQVSQAKPSQPFSSRSCRQTVSPAGRGPGAAALQPEHVLLL